MFEHDFSGDKWIGCGLNRRIGSLQGLSTAPPPARKRPEAGGAVDNPVFIAQAAACNGASVPK